MSTFEGHAARTWTAWKRQNHTLNQTAIPSPTRWTQAKVEDSSRPQPTTIVLTKNTVTLQNYLKPRKDQRQFSFQNLVTIRSKIYIPNTKHKSLHSSTPNIHLTTLMKCRRQQ